jgi:heme/copper-type cytochrome/quinol oxidase subunit 2
VGTNWESIANAFHGPSYIIAAVVLVVMVLAVWRYARRRQTEARPEARAAKHARDGAGPGFHDREDR